MNNCDKLVINRLETFMVRSQCATACCFADSFVKEFRIQNSMLKFEEQCILLVNRVSEYVKHSKCAIFC